MRIFDRKCLGCGSVYAVAESESLQGEPGYATCIVCGDEFDRWDEPNTRVCRLVIAAERPSLRVPPSVRELPQRRASSLKQAAHRPAPW
jgi:hypothetical protein